MVLEGLKPVKGVRQDFFSSPWLLHTEKGVVYSLLVGVEALRVGLSKVPFSLRACSAPEERSIKDTRLVCSQRTDAFLV